MAKQNYYFSDLKNEISDLSRELKLLSNDIKQDAFLSIIYTTDIVNRYLEVNWDRIHSHRTRSAILNALIVHNGVMNPTDISMAVNRSKYTVSRALKGLQKSGFINIRKGRADSRFKRISITKEGIEYVKRTLPDRHRVAEDVISAFSKDQIATLLSLLYLLRKHLLNSLSR